MRVRPRVLVEVICVIPAIRPNCRSNGDATEVAIFSGLAPGRPAVTLMVGKSTCGNAAMGNKLKATAPAMASPIANNVVAIGLWMKTAEKLITHPLERSQFVVLARFS